MCVFQNSLYLYRLLLCHGLLCIVCGVGAVALPGSPCASSRPCRARCRRAPPGWGSIYIYIYIYIYTYIHTYIYIERERERERERYPKSLRLQTWLVDVLMWFAVLLHALVSRLQIWLRSLLRRWSMLESNWAFNYDCGCVSERWDPHKIKQREHAEWYKFIMRRPL